MTVNVLVVHAESNPNNEAEDVGTLKNSMETKVIDLKKNYEERVTVLS